MKKLKTYKNAKEFAKAIKITDQKYLITLQKNKLIKVIIAKRKELKLTQADLASILDTTQSVIARVESGLSKSVSLDYIISILIVLGFVPNIQLKKAA